MDVLIQPSSSSSFTLSSTTSSPSSYLPIHSPFSLPQTTTTSTPTHSSSPTLRSTSLLSQDSISSPSASSTIAIKHSPLPLDSISKNQKPFSITTKHQVKDELLCPSSSVSLPPQMNDALSSISVTALPIPIPFPSPSHSPTFKPDPFPTTPTPTPLLFPSSSSSSSSFTPSTLPPLPLLHDVDTPAPSFSHLQPPLHRSPPLSTPTPTPTTTPTTTPTPPLNQDTPLPPMYMYIVDELVQTER
ncbi:hypothetical protein HMI54_000913, partial [Coelomomyces lativittatus]